MTTGHAIEIIASYIALATLGLLFVALQIVAVGLVATPPVLLVWGAYKAGGLKSAAIVVGMLAFALQAAYRLT